MNLINKDTGEVFSDKTDYKELSNNQLSNRLLDIKQLKSFVKDMEDKAKNEAIDRLNKNEDSLSEFTLITANRTSRKVKWDDLPKDIYEKYVKESHTGYQQLRPKRDAKYLE